MVLVGIVTDDVKAAVIADKLEIPMIRCQPAILDRSDADLACPHRQSPRRLFAPEAGIAIDPNIHIYLPGMIIRESPGCFFCSCSCIFLICSTMRAISCSMAPGNA